MRENVGLALCWASVILLFVAIVAFKTGTLRGALLGLGALTLSFGLFWIIVKVVYRRR